MVAAIVAASGETAAMFTTIGGRVGDETMAHTTPTTPGGRSSASFLATVEASVTAGVRTIAVEMTSLALARGTAATWPPDIAIFTNLTRDHLDVHPSPEAYLAAKAQLFLSIVPGGTAVLNLDDPSSELLREVLAPTTAVLTYSLLDPAADLAASSVTVDVGITRVTLSPGAIADRLGGAIEVGMTGHVHAANALAAALATLTAGYDPTAVKAGLRAFRGVAGRFQLIANPADGAGPVVFVDYAHTPDGLENTLMSGRMILNAMPDAERGRLICVFGCGGGRDRGKRPQMGAIADRLADVVYLTTDNPRQEAPEAIANEVTAEISPEEGRWHIEHDRRRAIRQAITGAKAALVRGRRDIVIIAGKGHETEQIIGNTNHPFDDAAEVRAAFEPL